MVVVVKLNQHNKAIFVMPLDILNGKFLYKNLKMYVKTGRPFTHAPYM